MINTKHIIVMERLANVTGVAGVLVLLILTQYFQFVLFDLPCPWCLLQRLGFFGMALGFIMNMRFGFRPSHYSIILISGFLTAGIALRQIVLHVVPGTGVYGSAVFGWHLYTWSFVIATVVMIIATLLLCFDRQYANPLNESQGYWRGLTCIIFCIFTILLLVNIVSIILMCGFKTCPSDPIQYELLSHWVSAVTNGRNA